MANRKIITGILMLSVVLTTALGQDPRPAADDDVIRITTDLVQTGVVVVDKQGKFVIEPKFEFADSFSGGLAAIRSGGEANGKYGFIDREGKTVITPQFDFADLFSASDGLAAVRIGDTDSGKYGYIAR